jgi:hypothetical protein
VKQGLTVAGVPRSSRIREEVGLNVEFEGGDDRRHREPK